MNAFVIVSLGMILIATAIPIGMWFLSDRIPKSELDPKDFNRAVALPFISDGEIPEDKNKTLDEDKHGLKELCKELINVDISKQKQSSDWGNNKLSHEQLVYAASDVLYLHKIKYELDIILKRENRNELAEKLFKFIGTRAYLDLNGWNEPDIFDH